MWPCRILYSCVAIREKKGWAISAKVFYCIPQCVCVWPCKWRELAGGLGKITAGSKKKSVTVTGR